jgi:hypothetical protein
VAKRIDKAWIVFSSIENSEANRCVDLFLRPDGTFGFEEFRKEPEDAGAWTPLQNYSALAYASKDDALTAAIAAVIWLAEKFRSHPAKT